MTYKDIIVDNHILASIISASTNSNIKLTSQDLNKQGNQYFFLPIEDISKNVIQYTLDTFGILNKSKLLMKEPITGNQISYIESDEKFDSSTEIKGLNIKTKDHKTFYFHEIDQIHHNYKNSIFTNIKSKNINIAFPTSEKIHLISDDIPILKKYVKKLSNRLIDDYSFSEIFVPKEIEIYENNKIINSIKINNKTFLGMTYQISKVFKILSKDIKSKIRASENDNNYINKIFFIFYNFIPNFITPFLFKFLLRLNQSNKFSNQVLEINNFYNFENYFFSNSIDDEFTISDFMKGRFLPQVTLIDKNKDLNNLLTDDNNIICSSQFEIKTKYNVIYLKTNSSKKQKGYIISQSSFERLNLEHSYYNVSSVGLILMADLIQNANKNSKLSLSKLKYSDQKQKSLDSFHTKDFRPSLPKLPKPRISFNWPLRTKKQ